MQLSKATAIYAAPLPLRVILAITFIWAGLGKFIHEIPVSGEQAALLANMGYKFPTQPPSQEDTDPEGEAQDEAPADQPTTTPPTETPATESDAEPSPHANNDQPSSLPETGTDRPIGSASHTPDEAETTSETAQRTGTDPADRWPNNAGRSTIPPLLAQASPPAQPTHTYTAAHFPEPQQVRSLYKLALLTYNASHPSNADGTSPAPIWPAWAARGHWPITLAWAAMATEVLAGLLIGIGLLTRLSAVAIAIIMLNAAWLTQLGPAIQAGDTHLGFLPAYSVWDIQAWRPLLWQASLFACAAALTLAGPGAIAVDRIGSDDEDSDELEED